MTDPIDFYSHQSAVIDAGAKIGSGTKIWHFCHVMGGAQIGNDCSLGQNVFVGGKAQIGNRVKIQNNVSVYDSVIIEDDVFCGPSCVFTNVLNPRSFVVRKEEYKITRVEEGVSIGANATIVCGVNIGKFAFIGAGAVVTHDVKSYALMVGVPAVQKGWMSRNGLKLKDDLKCPETGQQYEIIEGELRILSK